MDIQVQIQFNIGNTLMVSNDINMLCRTYLSDDYGAGVTALNVLNTDEFTPATLGLISSIGSQVAEFVTISTIPNQNSFGISSTLFAHNRGEIIQSVDYDQFVVQKSSTLNGVYTTYGVFSIQATQQYTQIVDSTGLATDYYRLQLKNSVTGHVSGYSTPVSAGALDPDSVGNLFDSITTGFGISPNDPIITTEFLLNALNEARTYVKDKMAGYKQGWLAKFEYPIGLSAGWNHIYLPDDYDYRFTNNALLAVRYPRINGLAPYPLTYVDKREWNATAYSLKYSYTNGPTVSGATTLVLMNIGDFLGLVAPSQSGTIFIATNDVTQKILEVTYTGVDVSTSSLTGCVGITRDIAPNTQCFAFPTFSSATYYTVYDDPITNRGIIVFNRPVPDIMQGRNVYLDYYAKMLPVTNINSVLDEPYKYIYRFYIRYAIKYRRDNSTNTKTDPDFQLFDDLVTQWINNHYIGQLQKVITR